MFKCKSCGRQFGANTPKQCPDCGAESQRPITDARGVSILLAIETIGTLAALTVAGLITAWVVGLF